MLTFARLLTFCSFFWSYPITAFAEDNIVEICQFGFHPERSETIKIDIEQRIAIGPDTRSTLMPLIQGDVIGFESPFPLAVPLAGTNVLEWESNAYRFRFSEPYDTEQDWIEISAEPLNSATNFTTSNVLFSKSEGVLAIRVDRTFEEVVSSVSLYRCGTVPFFPDDLASN